MNRREMVFSEDLGYGVVEVDNGLFIVVSFGFDGERIALERDDVEHIGYLDIDEDDYEE